MRLIQIYYFESNAVGVWGTLRKLSIGHDAVIWIGFARLSLFTTLKCLVEMNIADMKSSPWSWPPLRLCLYKSLWTENHISVAHFCSPNMLLVIFRALFYITNFNFLHNIIIFFSVYVWAVSVCFIHPLCDVSLDVCAPTTAFRCCFAFLLLLWRNVNNIRVWSGRLIHVDVINSIHSSVRWLSFWLWSGVRVVFFLSLSLASAQI